MSDVIEFVLPEPPEAFLQRLSRYGADWRDSRLPGTLRAQFVTGFRVRVDGDHFTLGVKPGFRGPQAICVGSVHIDPAGCRVRARTVAAPGARRPWLTAVASLAAVANAAIGRIPWWQAVTVSAVVLGFEQGAVALSLPPAVRRYSEVFAEMFAYLRTHPEAGGSAPAA